MKKIAYITGSRAEYGIVKRLLKRLQDDPEIEFSIIATAMHLDPRYGNTIEIIEKDGFKVQHQIPITISNQDNLGILNSINETIKKFSDLFNKMQYDSIIILGDRYEMFAVAIAAAFLNIPIIHLHGGEQTLGNYDEFIRHNITKMAQLHLASTEIYRKRIIQLGEHPNTVHNIGALGAENTLKLPLLNKKELEQALNINLQPPYFVIIFHPETLNYHKTTTQIQTLLESLKKFKNEYKLIFIGANADTSSDEINKQINKYIQKNNGHLFLSLAPEHYLSLIKHADCIIGNSSSGILEAPSLHTATVNIGDRQKGRVQAKSIINCASNEEEIIYAIKKATSLEFQQNLKKIKNPYFKKNASENAYLIIKDFLNKKPSNTFKNFFDIQIKEL